MSQKQNDLQRIKKLIEIMKNNDLVEIEINHGDDKIFLKRSQPQQNHVSIAAVPLTNTHLPNAVAAGETQQKMIDQEPAAIPQQDDDLVEIKSPIVGTFYATPSPDSEPYVEVDSHVDSQTVVCIIEAMKVMNEIKAETAGTIAEILISNGQAVEYGQVLFKIKPD